MLGNWSFGDYFKERRHPVGVGAGHRGRSASTATASGSRVYDDDDEAAAIWRDSVGLPAERIQRLGDDDNFWEMGDTGPCGPCSEIYFDRGPEWGAEGGPAPAAATSASSSSGTWSSCSTTARPTARLSTSPQRNIDTGAGLERILIDPPGRRLRSGRPTSCGPIIAAAEALTGRTYGDDPEVDVALRILADHARSMTFLINDGVFPEQRGPRLRAAPPDPPRRPPGLPARGGAAGDAGAGRTPSSTSWATPTPTCARNDDFVTGVAAREEERFRATLRSGLAMLEAALAGGRADDLRARWRSGCTTPTASRSS